jgi:hypothetical protein
MRQPQGSKSILLFAFLTCIAVAISPAARADQKLLSLVPPGAQAVARISSPSPSAVMGHFVLTSHNNGVNFNDFLALSGVDSTLVIHELIQVVAADSAGMLNEHGLLASGNFDRECIYRSALSGGASVTRYRGLPVLVVQPFARSRSEFNEVRWLAIPDSSILLFGSIASVQQELDRHLDRSTADPRLVARLARLRRDNNSWSVLSLPTWTSDIRDSLAAITPKLAELLKDGDTLEFGIHYGRQVEFEYEVTTASSHTAHAMSASLTQSLAGLGKESAFRSTDVISEGTTVHGVIKVSMARYNAWLTEVLARGRGRNTAFP